MNQKIILISLLLIFFSFRGYAQNTGKKDNPPNFVFIIVDDLGWADIQCNYPGSFHDTPNIDRLAENGIRFTQAYAAHPVCSPTRAALMTGKHPNRVNITDWIPGKDPRDRPLLGPQDRTELALEETTLAEILKEAGYQTFFAGKWHLGDEGFFPEDQGFDINKGGHHRGSPPGGYYSPYKNPILKDGPEGEYLPDRLTNESIGFLDSAGEKPFLLYLSFYTVHTPIQAARNLVEKYQNRRENMDIDEVPHKKEGEGWTKLIQENPAYGSMVEAMDRNVGRLVNALQEKGLDQNTWIIFTSDNGGLSTLTRKNAPTCNGPLRAGKGWCYEGGIRVPLIISGPGIASPGRTTDQPAVSMDYFTTVLNLAGIAHHSHDGENLVPLLTGNQPTGRDALFWHFPHYHGSAWKPGSALRQGHWKLVVHYESNQTELFNLANDPGEKTNLARSMPEKTAALKKILDEKLAETNARFPKPNPDFTNQH